MVFILSEIFGLISTIYLILCSLLYFCYKAILCKL
nr:MAG TPA: hypothetical protein [Crassvirales sp.]